jgi:uncharacterized protein
MPAKLCHIVVGEFENGSSNQLLYLDILHTLLAKDFAGVTLIRADEGIGEKNEILALNVESIPFNNLPIEIETIEEDGCLNGNLPEILDQISQGKVVTIPVYRAFSEELTLHDDDFLMLKIFINEKTHWLRTPLHEKIIHLLREHHLTWSIAKQGLAGYGKDKVIHKKSFFPLSSQVVPVVIESIGQAAIIKKVIPVLRKQVKDGLVIAIPVNVIL